MIIARYIIGQIGKATLAILGVLAALFASYSAEQFFGDASRGLLPLAIAARMIGLELLISLEVLIPISLFLAVVLVFGRLNSDSEVVAMYALRVTPARVRHAVLVLAGGVGVVVALLSLFGRPWAYAQMHAISRHAQGALNVDAIQAGSFYVARQGNLVIYLGHREGPASPARGVFVRRRQEGVNEVIHAAAGYRLPPEKKGGDPRILLRDAHVVELATGEMVSAGTLTVDPYLHFHGPPPYSPLAAGTWHLARSGEPADVAELQWRLSTGISTLLLALLGIPLGETRPRQGRHEKFGVAVLIYAAYYLASSSARTWVQNGVVPPVPGLWWAPALLAAVVLVATYGPELWPRLRRRWA